MICCNRREPASSSTIPQSHCIAVGVGDICCNAIQVIMFEWFRAFRLAKSWMSLEGTKSSVKTKTVWKEHLAQAVTGDVLRCLGGPGKVAWKVSAPRALWGVPGRFPEVPGIPVVVPVGSKGSMGGGPACPELLGVGSGARELPGAVLVVGRSPRDRPRKYKFEYVIAFSIVVTNSTLFMYVIDLFLDLFCVDQTT